MKKGFRRTEYVSIFEQWEWYGKSKPTKQTLEQADSDHCSVTEQEARRKVRQTDSCPRCCHLVGEAVGSPASEKAGLGRASRKQGWAWISCITSVCVCLCWGGTQGQPESWMASL